MIIDTHCHIYSSEMKNAESIILEAGKKNMELILNGTDPSSNREILDLSGKYRNVHAALGYFHSFADEIIDDDISILDDQLKNNNVVAVGEIGLDYYYGKENRNEQKDLFEKMLGLAEKHDLPVIVHSRKSLQDTYNILKRYDVVGSMHCYQGSAEMAREFIKLGFYMGIGGPVTHRNNKKVRRMLNNISVNNILVETDSPYLAPEEKISEKNTPMNLKYIIRKIAEEYGMGEDEVIAVTTDNARRLFKI